MIENRDYLSPKQKERIKTIAKDAGADERYALDLFRMSQTDEGITYAKALAVISRDEAVKIRTAATKIIARRVTSMLAAKQYPSLVTSPDYARDMIDEPKKFFGITSADLAKEINSTTSSRYTGETLRLAQLSKHNEAAMELFKKTQSKGDASPEALLEVFRIGYDTRLAMLRLKLAEKETAELMAIHQAAAPCHEMMREASESYLARRSKTLSAMRNHDNINNLAGMLADASHMFGEGAPGVKEMRAAFIATPTILKPVLEDVMVTSSGLATEAVRQKSRDIYGGIYPEEAELPSENIVKNAAMKLDLISVRHRLQ